MSSEIEEFVGFASRVLVFRHGTLFEEFVGTAIDPPRILEAMFGQTRGDPGHGGAAKRGPLPMKIIDFDKEDSHRIAEEQIRHVKVVDFGDEPAATAPPRAPAIGTTPIRIVDFSDEGRAARARQMVGRIKVIDFDQAANAESSPSAPATGIKIVEFDDAGRARPAR